MVSEEIPTPDVDGMAVGATTLLVTKPVVDPASDAMSPWGASVMVLALAATAVDWIGYCGEHSSPAPSFAMSQSDAESVMNGSVLAVIFTGAQMPALSPGTLAIESALVSSSTQLLPLVH